MASFKGKYFRKFDFNNDGKITFEDPDIATQECLDLLSGSYTEEQSLRMFDYLSDEYKDYVIAEKSDPSITNYDELLNYIKNTPNAWTATNMPAFSISAVTELRDMVYELKHPADISTIESGRRFKLYGVNETTAKKYNITIGDTVETLSSSKIYTANGAVNIEKKK